MAWWLPMPDAFMLRGPLPNGNDHMISTTGSLHKELEHINELTWQAGEEEILHWSETEGYPADAFVREDGTLSREDIPEHTRFDTQSLAKFAFSILWQALRFAEEQQVPVLLDF